MVSTSLFYMYISIHPLYVTVYPVQGRGGAGADPSIRRRRGPPWTDRLSITGLTHTDRQPFTFTPTGNLDIQQLTCMSLDCGGKPEHPEKTHANTGKTCILRTAQKGPKPCLNLRPSCCEATVLTIYLYI